MIKNTTKWTHPEMQYENKLYLWYLLCVYLTAAAQQLSEFPIKNEVYSNRVRFYSLNESVKQVDENKADTKHIKSKWKWKI